MAGPSLKALTHTLIPILFNTGFHKRSYLKVLKPYMPSEFSFSWQVQSDNVNAAEELMLVSIGNR